MVEDPAAARRSRVDALTVVLGVVLTVVGVAGVVVSVVVGHVSAAVGSVVWLLVGALVLGFGVRARRRDSAA